MTNVNFKPQQWMDSATSDYWLYGMPIEPELLCGFCKANFDRDTRKRLFNNFCIQVANIVYMYFFIQYDIETKEYRYDIIIGIERDNSDVGGEWHPESFLCFSFFFLLSQNFTYKLIN